MKLYFDYKFLFEHKQIIVRAVIITLLILSALFLFLFRTGDRNEEDMLQSVESDSQTTTKNDVSLDVIIIDVTGEVKNPSVIELPVDSRINDAIQAVGGLTANADISQINRAAILSDGEKVYIPTKIDAPSDNVLNSNEIDNKDNSGTPENTGDQLININYASAAKLQEVPGIGPVTADKILQYRQVNGLFRKIDDIKKVSGIGDKTFAKMKLYICI
jgi:competence protein ComEA